jgi:Small metal-binding protein
MDLFSVSLAQNHSNNLLSKTLLQEMSMKLTNTKRTGLWAGIVLAMCSTIAFAQNSHLSQAIMNTQAATKSATAKGIAEHAGVALTHAQAAKESGEAGAANEHLDAGITSLEQAVEHGNQGHLDLAKQAAVEAKTHLKAAR